MIAPKQREVYFIRWLIIPSLSGGLLGHSVAVNDWITFWGTLSIFLWHLHLATTSQ